MDGVPAGPLRAFSEALVAGGVRDVVICPGSRSTPLALALRAHPELRTWVHVDERAGAFFALGMARASRRPTAILVTSGTAAMELGPAVVEACQGRVAVIAITADRPPEARDRGLPQTIDQVHLFGRFAKWFVELPLPEADPAVEGQVRAVVGRAVASAMAEPAGAVHIDAPFREPLVPEGDLRPAAGGSDDPVAFTGVRVLPDMALRGLAARMAEARRGLIVCGPLDRPGFAPAVAALAAASGFPILADALSNVRFGSHDHAHVIARADTILRAARTAERLRPDLVIRFGGTPVSRVLVDRLSAGQAAQIAVDDGGWTEPTGLPVTMVVADPVLLADALAAHLDGPVVEAGWLAAWRAADDAAAAATRDWLAALDEPFEGQAFEGLGAVLSDGALLPDGAILLVGNSMPVRDMEALLGSGPGSLRCLGHRGASGIDGLVSAALGMAAVADQPVVAVVGDIAFLHDLNALTVARRLGLSATIVLIDNDGGGIFSLLPQAAVDRPEVGLPERFEELFGTPHGLDLGPIAVALGAEHRVVAPNGVAAAVGASLHRPGVQVLHVRTSRVRNAALHRDLASVVARRLDEAVAAAGLSRP